MERESERGDRKTKASEQEKIGKIKLRKGGVGMEEEKKEKKEMKLSLYVSFLRRST
jgi:hypothetical protein